MTDTTLNSYPVCEMTGKEIVEYGGPSMEIGYVGWSHWHWHKDNSVCRWTITDDTRTFEYIPRTWAGITGADDDPITITEPIIHSSEDLVPF